MDPHDYDRCMGFGGIATRSPGCCDAAVCIDCATAIRAGEQGCPYCDEDEEGTE